MATNEFGLPSEAMLAEKLDTQNVLLASIAAAQGGVTPTSWKDVQNIVRNGLAPKVFAVGDQFTVKRGSANLVFDIIGFDHDVPADAQFKHSMTLQLHDAFDGTQYDAPEAIYYAEEELPAGTYNFTIVAYDKWAAGTYQFTTTKAIPAGGQVVLNGYYAYNGAFTNAKIRTYSKQTDTTPLETDLVITAGSGGTALQNVNHVQRISYGSSNWSESAMRQFLNSDKAAGSVWTPQTKYDRPPSWVSSLAGWQNGMDAEFLKVIGAVTKRTCKNNVNEGGGYTDTKDKFFLLSRTEVFMNPEVSSVDEGAPYDYYKNYSDYTSRNDGADKNRIKYRSSAAQWWWLRTPRTGDAGSVRRVGTTGQLHNYGAYHGDSVAPACNII